MIKSFILLLSTLFLISCSDSNDDKFVEYYSNDLNVSSIPFDKTYRVRVYQHYSDGAKIDISKNLIWKSSNTALATVDAGEISPNSIAGDVNISYESVEKFSDGSSLYSDSFTLRLKDVNLTSISISPSDKVSIAKGNNIELSAEGLYDDGSNYDITSDSTWHSLDATICSVGKGVVKGLSEGSCNIYASCDGVDSAQIVIAITKIEYTSIDIKVQTNEFNVKQIKELELRAATSSDQTVILDGSDINWSSSDDTIVSVSSSGVATAVAKGDANITATISDANISDTITLSVLRDSYMRLFDKEGKELSFESVGYHIFDRSDDKNLSTFTIKAVGDKSFTISELNVSDINKSMVFGSAYSFDGISNGDTIDEEDGNITFYLLHDKNQKELRYSFKIDDELSSRFDQIYVDED